VLAVLLPGLVALGANRGYFLGMDARARMRAMYGAEPFHEASVIAKWVAQNTAEDQRLFVLGAEPEVYFLSRRRPASRYIYSYPLQSALDPAGQHRRNLLDDLEAHPPGLLLVFGLPGSWPFQTDADPELMAAMEQFMQDRYVLEGTWTLGQEPEQPGRVTLFGVAAPVQIWRHLREGPVSGSR
jgi:hypothetical protein